MITQPLLLAHALLQSIERAVDKLFIPTVCRLQGLMTSLQWWPLSSTRQHVYVFAFVKRYSCVKFFNGSTTHGYRNVTKPSIPYGMELWLQNRGSELAIYHFCLFLTATDKYTTKLSEVSLCSPGPLGSTWGLCLCHPHSINHGRDVL